MQTFSVDLSSDIRVVEKAFDEVGQNVIENVTNSMEPALINKATKRKGQSGHWVVLL